VLRPVGEWVCMSMRPGTTVKRERSRMGVASGTSRFSPTASILPFAM
jgi:hypothetical protein